MIKIFLKEKEEKWMVLEEATTKNGERQGRKWCQDLLDFEEKEEVTLFS